MLDDSPPAGVERARPSRDYEIRLEVARRSYAVARTRYVRSVIACEIRTRYASRVREREEFAAAAAQQRDVHQSACESVSNAIRGYARCLPHRVNDLGVQPPSLFEGLFGFGMPMRRYRRVLDAANRRREAARSLETANRAAATAERRLRANLSERERVIERTLDSEKGLSRALRLDPLLDLSYRRLRGVMDEGTFLRP